MSKTLITALKLSALVLPLSLAACATKGDLQRVEATANQARTTAEQANQTANAAQTTANEAINRANTAQTTANEAMNRVNQIQQQMAAQPQPQPSMGGSERSFERSMRK
ncbi:MAG: Lpp/OprI family alanine-zipper lipoprotein [Pseudomonadota bacterium]|uniref:Lpp/OprI family alanine-zipper lipoprotein n=1 Tax=Thermithiobacillus tepidarius TaxID=929 RepID=UPI00041F6D0E|nr:Lpp/OprI family alanine-zipper lipoprotein [Thermithiobacillus tepidarius]